MGWRDERVRERVAVVTGAARGIGLATAERLLRSGARVGLGDVDEIGLVRAVERLSSLGEVRGYVLDVTNAEDFARVLGRVQRELGDLDILVNNAGIMPVGSFLEQDGQVDRQQLDVNLHGVINGMRAALPGMLARHRGHVVNIASVAGRVGTPHIAVYSASKHAVIGLTEAVRAEHLESGVHFSYVCPVLVRTELISGTGRPVWPPPVGPDEVARAVEGAIRRRRVDVYVPRVSRLSVILPALLPRPLYERIGKALGLDRMFSVVDPEGRRDYRRRIRRATSPGT